MNSETSQIFESYVPVYDAIPESWEEAKPFIVENFKKISNAINIREIGWYLDEQLLSGKAFIPGVSTVANNVTQQFRQILRKVIDFGALQLGTKSVPHGIVFNDRFTLIQLWASSTDPVAFVAIPIPFVSTTGGDVEINMTVTNINITCTTNRASFTRTFVFVEYIQEL